MQIRYDDDDEDEGPQPDPTLEQGVPIPVRMQGGFPPELASTPLEDIDAFYSNKLVSFLFIYGLYIYLCICFFLHLEKKAGSLHFFTHKKIQLQNVL